MHSPERVARERVLRSAVLSGDTEAWRVLYEENFEGLDRYVQWRCRALCSLAEEIIQETWLTAVRHIKRFDPDQGSFSGWLRGIAAKHLANAFRNRSLRLASVSRNGVDQEHNCQAKAGPHHEENAERVALALASLPEHYEAVLRAKYLDGLSVIELANERHESPKAIESLLTRARQAFREIYQQQE
jgi:RNA polymerase sigma-70 factor, ECF subfamily